MAVPYGEGTVFLIPLRGGGFARGVLARMKPKGRTLFAYFFGPRLDSAADAGLTGLSPDAAIARLRFGDLGLVRKQWPLLGRLPGWNRAEWPMPPFIRYDPMERLPPALITYADDDPSTPVDERPAAATDGHDRAALFGSAAVENRLDSLLSAGDA